LEDGLFSTTTSTTTQQQQQHNNNNNNNIPNNNITNLLVAWKIDLSADSMPFETAWMEME